MFKDVFVNLLQEYNETKSQVFRATGISTGLLSEYASGIKTPSNKNLTILAKYFGVSIDYLLGGEQKEKPTDNVDELSEEYKNIVNDLMKLSPEQLEVMKKLLRSLQND